MMTSQHSHVAFADESNWNRGRFRSIALISAAVGDARAFRRELDEVSQERREDAAAPPGWYVYPRPSQMIPRRMPAREGGSGDL